MRIALCLATATSFASIFGISPDAEAACPALPYTITNGQIADANQLMSDLNSLSDCASSAAPAGLVNGLQFNAGGVFGGVVPLSDGQIVVGSTGNPPQARTLASGSGISITDSGTNLTISSTVSGAINPYYDPNSIPLTKPTASSFTIEQSNGNAGSITDMATRGVALTTPSIGDAIIAMKQPITDNTSFTETALVYPVSFMAGNWFFGIGVRDSDGKYVAFGFRNWAPVSYFHYANISSYAGSSTGQGIANPQMPMWLRVVASSGNFNFSFSFDGEHFTPGWTVSMTEYLNGNPTDAGLMIENNNTGQTFVLDVLSWTNVSP